MDIAVCAPFFSKFNYLIFILSKLNYISIFQQQKSVVLQIMNEFEKPEITGGPMYDHRFKFEQIHFHWGAEGRHNSENQINGIGYVIFFIPLFAFASSESKY